MDSSITTLKVSASSASRGPAFSSLPQGAGKCPRTKVTLAPVRPSSANRRADSTATVPCTPRVRPRPCSSRRSSGAPMALSSANSRLMQGIFIQIDTCLPPSLPGSAGRSARRPQSSAGRSRRARIKITSRFRLPYRRYSRQVRARNSAVVLTATTIPVSTSPPGTGLI